ncbi:MAG: hypothetical protein IPG85_09820 [Bacteroidetes bacterium]|nr:hypothetical protein [Bacteroidota bacterium]
MLTAGVSLEQFEKNPIMLWMHGRAWGGGKDAILPLGHWQDIKGDKNQITAVPCFSDDDEFAMSIYKKVEENTIRMASVGLDPIESSEDEKYLVPGQRYATVTKSMMLEASIVDMGSNDNACALYKDGAVIQLADGDHNHVIPLLNNKNSNMNPQLMALAIMLGLGKDATEIQLTEKLTTQHADYLKLSKENTDLQNKLNELQSSYDALQKSTSEKEVNDMLTLAVKQGKITEAQKPELATLAAASLESVQKLLDKMPVHITAEERLSTEKENGGDPLLKMTFSELHKNGKLALVKEKYPDHYKSIYKEKYGSEPKV